LKDYSPTFSASPNYFNNTPTVKIVENIDRHAIDREKDLDLENIDRTPINNNGSISVKMVRRDAAFIPSEKIFDNYSEVETLPVVLT
jgi:hypothetical protein